MSALSGDASVVSGVSDMELKNGPSLEDLDMEVEGVSGMDSDAMNNSLKDLNASLEGLSNIVVDGEELNMDDLADLLESTNPVDEAAGGDAKGELASELSSTDVNTAEQDGGADADDEPAAPKPAKRERKKQRGIMGVRVLPPPPSAPLPPPPKRKAAGEKNGGTPSRGAEPEERPAAAEDGQEADQEEIGEEDGERPDADNKEEAVEEQEEDPGQGEENQDDNVDDQIEEGQDEENGQESEDQEDDRVDSPEDDQPVAAAADAPYEQDEQDDQGSPEEEQNPPLDESGGDPEAGKNQSGKTGVTEPRPDAKRAPEPEARSAEVEADDDNDAEYYEDGKSRLAPTNGSTDAKLTPAPVPDAAAEDEVEEDGGLQPEAESTGEVGGGASEDFVAAIGRVARRGGAADEARVEEIAADDEAGPAPVGDGPLVESKAARRDDSAADSAAQQELTQKGAAEAEEGARDEARVEEQPEEPLEEEDILAYFDDDDLPALQEDETLKELGQLLSHFDEKTGEIDLGGMYAEAIDEHGKLAMKFLQEQFQLLRRRADIELERNEALRRRKMRVLARSRETLTDQKQRCLRIETEARLLRRQLKKVEILSPRTLERKELLRNTAAESKRKRLARSAANKRPPFSSRIASNSMRFKRTGDAKSENTLGALQRLIDTCEEDRKRSPANDSGKK